MFGILHNDWVKDNQKCLHGYFEWRQTGLSTSIHGVLLHTFMSLAILGEDIEMIVSVIMAHLTLVCEIFSIGSRMEE